MEDADLEAIRQKRMMQLAQQQGGGQGGGPQNPEAAAQQEEQRQAAEERRRMMLLQVLQPSARERLARIALVKPDKARGVENLLLQMAQRGQITEKGTHASLFPLYKTRFALGSSLSREAQVSEERLIQLLEQINQSAGAGTGTRVTIQRRRPAWDDD